MITLDNLSDAAARSFEGLPDARQRELAQQMVRHLHAFARSTALTHAEWRAAIGFLHRTGALSNDTRSEFTLLSDVLGLSSLVDLIGSSPGGTPGSVLGPFHTAGSPWSDNPADLVRDNPGERVRLQGHVLDRAGHPLPGATLDFWQNADNGLYWQVDATQPSDNLRCRLRTDAQGGYCITTIRPRPYCIPTDGPVWQDLVGPAGRTAWRPAHFHLIVEAPGHRSLITEVFDAQDPYLAGDAVFGVRDGLIGRYEAGADGLPTMRFDFTLAAG
jgi:hydroxyquinol 1,2-dioxygenase